MKIVFVNRYFHPDHSATSQIASELAFDLVARGEQVHVVTSRQLYDKPAMRLPPQEITQGVVIHRVWTSRFGRARLVGRACDYLTFYVSAFWRLVMLLARGDIVVAKTDPPIVGFVAALAAKMKRAVLVNWLQDVFPEVAQRLGVAALNGAMGRIARGLRDFSVRSAAVNVAVGERMADFFVQEGIARQDQMRVIHNWSDAEAIVPNAPGVAVLRRQWGLEGKFVIAYSGNMGRAHDFETIVQAMDTFRARDDIVFLFIGAGHQSDWLRREIAARGLSSIARFEPYQPRENLGASLGAGDVHLVTLNPRLEGFIVPSKFYGIVAAQRPVLFVGDPEGEIARLIRLHDCGRYVEVGDVSGLAGAMAAFRDDAGLRERQGLNGRNALSTLYDRKVALATWYRLLQDVAARG